MVDYLLKENPYEKNRLCISAVDEFPFTTTFDPNAYLIHCKKFSSDMGKLKSTVELAIRQRSLAEVYHMWQLAGGDLKVLCSKNGLFKKTKPISTLPNYSSGASGQLWASPCSNPLIPLSSPPNLDEASCLDCSNFKFVKLTLNALVEKVSSVLGPTNSSVYDVFAVLFPLLYPMNGTIEKNSSREAIESSVHSTAKLPLLIKEQDVLYQFVRMMLFKRLLEVVSFERHRIWDEARIDIPPLYRAQIWAALLDVESNPLMMQLYDQVDSTSSSAGDRQLEVDIPRCHQYDETLSSPVGHAKLKRIMKAWLASNPRYVYWQGLDSLIAPFLKLNFTNESLVLACLCRFVDKYMEGLFAKDNSSVLNEYLAIYEQLLAFHDPELSNRLVELEFSPNMYAISWFLTMFAHEFPVERIYHLWDTLLLGNQHLPWFIAISIIVQMRPLLLTISPCDCLLLFSDLPEIDLERCRKQAISMFCSTPKTSLLRFQNIVARGEKSDKVDKNGTKLSDPTRRLEPIPVAQLQAERCPRIAAQEVMQICGLGSHGSSANGASQQEKRNVLKLVMIDIRSTNEFKKGAVTGSINLPYTVIFDNSSCKYDLEQLNAASGHVDASLENCDLSSSKSFSKLFFKATIYGCAKAVNLLRTNPCRNAVKVVMGSFQSAQSTKLTLNFSETLVRYNITKVCVLHNGIEAFRYENLLELQD